MKKILFYIIYFFSFILLLLIVAVSFFHITDFCPEEEEFVDRRGQNCPSLIEKNNISVMIWNIGYAGLGKEMDFFYDGGKQVRPDKETYHKYLNEIISTIKQNDTVDFILLQEVDVDSKRSYYTDQFQMMLDTLKEHCGYFALNYQCPFVPVPLTNPMGKTTSGICILSKYQALESKRVAFENKESFPNKYFVLDRCCLVNRYLLPNKKQLVLVNTHNSAYDNGEERTEQVKWLAELMKNEIRKGSYVIIGGDWNQLPPGYNNSTYSNNQNSEWYNSLISIDTTVFPESTQYYYDITNPTNRSLEKPWENGKNFETIIDFFSHSSNLIKINITSKNKNFSCSDHHFVIATFLLLDKKI